MNCAGNERLLALHAGGDLPDRQARALSAHLRTCDACRRVAADFAAGRELLGAHEPPEFDAAFFDALRQGVLREIDDDAPTPPAFARLTALLFGRRALALAACVAFLVAAGAAIVPHLRDGRRQTTQAPRQLADAAGETRQEHAATSAVDPPGMRDDETKSERAPTVIAPAPRREQYAAGVRRATRARRDARIAQPAPPALDEAVAAAQVIDDASAGEGAAAEVANLNAPAERKMLRIELQTGDPNVRIIWLSPQAPEKLPR